MSERLTRPPSTAPVPDGFGIELDKDTRLFEERRLVLGGSPLTLIRLGDRAQATIERWLLGAPIFGEAEGALARRLELVGIVYPTPPDLVNDDTTVTVVVPTHGRAIPLRRLLTSLGKTPTIVVDDGSSDPLAISSLAAEFGCTYLRREHCGGPGAARNTGLGAVETPFVAFVDSDCVVGSDFLSTLLPHFADPAVAAVAPRVASLLPKGLSWRLRFEMTSSPLDRGTRPSIVRPRARVPFIPGAALLVRRDAIPKGFDETLRFGEDVDLVWRLGEQGWVVRFDPRAIVWHEARSTTRAAIAQRVAYGSSAAALSIRHPRALAPVVISSFSALFWVWAASGKLGRAFAVLGVNTALTARRLRGSVTRPVFLAARIVIAGNAKISGPLASNALRAWGPLGCFALFSRRCRRPIVLAALWGALSSWHKAPRERLDPARFVGAQLVDDLAYSIGVWRGCLRQRTLRPLIPELVMRRRTSAARR